MIDVIPDIHGQAATLEAALRALGYSERGAVWRHGERGRTALFLGDLVDGGPEQDRTLSIVRGMVEAGSALCLMGNHELNAIHFHSFGADDLPLRPHTRKNVEQHKAFLRAFPLGSDEAREAIAWMETLPLAIETDGLRAAHACWSEHDVDVLRRVGTVRGTDGGLAIHLDREALHAAADASSEIGRAVETALKGPEVELPAGASFTDKSGHRRSALRLAWWREGARTYREAAISVPPDQVASISNDPLPPGASAAIYPPTAPPVVFGHYWLDPEAEPTLQAPNALCLDHSAGKGGPLVTYAHEPGKPLDPARIRRHATAVEARP